jgi:hypothetical protein
MAEHDCEPWTTTGSSATHHVPRFLGLKIERQERELQKQKPLLASSAPEEAGRLQAAVCGLEHDRQRRCLEREMAAKMSRPLTVVFGPLCRPVERDMALHSTARDKQEEGQDDFLSLGCSLVESVEEVANVAVEKEVAIESVTSWDAVTGEALLQTRCETSGSSYAMFWERYQYIVPSHIFQPATAQTLKTISMVTVYSKRTGALTSESFRQERLRHHGCRDLRDARAQGEPSEDGNDRFLS